LINKAYISDEKPLWVRLMEHGYEPCSSPRSGGADGKENVMAFGEHPANRKTSADTAKNRHLKGDNGLEFLGEY
jgi:hypothetical protein